MIPRNYRDQCPDDCCEKCFFFGHVGHGSWRCLRTNEGDSKHKKEPSFDIVPSGICDYYNDTIREYLAILTDKIRNKIPEKQKPSKTRNKCPKCGIDVVNKEGLLVSDNQFHPPDGQICLERQLSQAKEKLERYEIELDAIRPRLIGFQNAELLLSRKIEKEQDWKDKRIKALEDALTPSIDTKRMYMGEFSFPTTYDDMGHKETIDNDVPWTTIKEIMTKILSTAKENENND